MDTPILSDLGGDNIILSGGTFPQKGSGTRDVGTTLGKDLGPETGILPPNKHTGVKT